MPSRMMMSSLAKGACLQQQPLGYVIKSLIKGLLPLGMVFGTTSSMLLTVTSVLLMYMPLMK